MGVEDAARRVREHFDTISLAECVRSYDAVCADEDRDTVAYALQHIFLSSPTLTAKMSSHELMEEADSTAVAEFEEAAIRMIDHIKYHQ